MSAVLGLGAWLAALSPTKRVLLALASLAFLVEIALRLFAPTSWAYSKWTKAIEAVGQFWTAVLLSLVYFLPLFAISVCMRLLGKDLLDRGLKPELTFWRSHDPNPLGPEAAARHQF